MQGLNDQMRRDLAEVLSHDSDQQVTHCLTYQELRKSCSMGGKQWQGQYCTSRGFRVQAEPQDVHFSRWKLAELHHL